MRKNMTAELIKEAERVARGARRDAELLIEDAWSVFVVKNDLSPELEARLRDHPHVRL